jgi:hypothetical protein
MQRCPWTLLSCGMWRHVVQKPFTEASNESTASIFGAEESILRGLLELIFCCCETSVNFVRFEVFTAVTMKNAVFWEVAPCRSGVRTRSTLRHIPENGILYQLTSSGIHGVTFRNNSRSSYSNPTSHWLPPAVSLVLVVQKRTLNKWLINYLSPLRRDFFTELKSCGQ